jgi:hypothetical protein
MLHDESSAKKRRHHGVHCRTLKATARESMDAVHPQRVLARFRSVPRRRPGTATNAAPAGPHADRNGKRYSFRRFELRLAARSRTGFRAALRSIPLDSRAKASALDSSADSNSGPAPLR